MSDFINSVDVKVRVNIFCDGKVQSRTLRYPDGTMKTLGVSLPGDFEFHSVCPESVVLTAGEVEVNFPDGKGWQKIKTGERYEVPANTVFQVRCSVISEYICDFL